jgi:hypothetical protein
MRAPRSRERRKIRRPSSLSLHVKLPAKRVRAKFNVVYELQGAQKGVNFLTRYYRVRRLRIAVDRRRVPRKCGGVYLKNIACFTREDLKKRVILHELYHHLVETKGHDLQSRLEEKEANSYSRGFTGVE